MTSKDSKLDLTALLEEGKEAKEEVATWPSWKRQLLGSKVTLREELVMLQRHAEANGLRQASSMLSTLLSLGVDPAEESLEIHVKQYADWYSIRIGTSYYLASPSKGEWVLSKYDPNYLTLTENLDENLKHSAALPQELFSLKEAIDLAIRLETAEREWIHRERLCFSIGPEANQSNAVIGTLAFTISCFDPTDFRLYYGTCHTPLTATSFMSFDKAYEHAVSLVKGHGLWPFQKVQP